MRSTGLADITRGVPVVRSTSFAWFSITKLFTATAILRLVEAGRLDLDAPVSRYLPEVRVARSNKEATVRHRLAHAAGLRNPIPVAWIHLTAEPAPSLVEVVRQRVGAAPETRLGSGREVLVLEPGLPTAWPARRAGVRSTLPGPRPHRRAHPSWTDGFGFGWRGTPRNLRGVPWAAGGQTF